MFRKNNLVVLAFGSNQGNRELALKSALKIIEIKTSSVSNIYETEAILPPDAPPNWNLKFLNMVASGYTKQSPADMLSHIKNTENLIGRNNTYERWSPRVIDIDILFYEDKIINTKNLTIPHPELQEREFVLRPLCDIMPDYVHPVYNKSIKTLLEELNG